MSKRRAKDEPSRRLKESEASESTLKKELIKALVVLIIGMLSFVLFDPIKQILKYKVWPEKIEITGNFEAVAGIEKQSRVNLLPKSFAGISGGTLKFEPREGSGIKIVGERTFVFDKSDVPIYVPQGDESLVYVASNTGDYLIDAFVSTTRGKEFANAIPVKIVESNKVRKANFTGDWRVRMNDNLGIMKIQQNSETDRHFAGEILFDDSLGIEIDVNNSYWDGSAIIIYANRAESEFEIKARYCYIENANTTWIIMEGEYLHYDQNGELLKLDYVLPSKFEEKCPTSDGKSITPLENAGRFWAQAEAHSD